MNKPLLKYNFTASGPLPDENGVIKQGTAVRIAQLRGEVRAYDTKEAADWFLKCPEVKAIADYNNIDINSIIEGTDPAAPELMTLVMLEEGSVVAFQMKKVATTEQSVVVTT